MAAVSAALLLLQAASTPLPQGQIYLGRASASPGEKVPALLALTGGDTATTAVTVRVAALPGGSLWWRGDEARCGPRPRDARSAVEWSGTVRGDAQLALCVQTDDRGPLRLAATIRALQPDGTWRVRSAVSEPVAPGAPLISGTAAWGIVTGVVGFFAGLLANLFQLRQQQRGERAQKRMEMEQDRAAKEEERLAAERKLRLEIDREVYGSVVAEMQKNVDLLRAFAASRPSAGEKPLKLTRAGLNLVMKDPKLSAYLRDAAQRPVLERMTAVHAAMGEYNDAVGQEGDPQKWRDLATGALARIEKLLGT